MNKNMNKIILATRKLKAFWKAINMEGGEEYGADSKLIENVFARTGSYIMGKRLFEEGEVHWAEDLFKADVYVLTHEKKGQRLKNQQ
jgi:hypothetical protein